MTSTLSRLTASTTVVLLLAAGASSGDDVRIVNLPANDLAYDPVSGHVLASVPSRQGSRGNTITGVDPLDGSLVYSTFVGSEPNRIALSDNGEDLYVGLDGAAAARRFHIPTRSAGLQFSLGSDGFTGPFYAEDIAVLPGDPDSIAVSRRNEGFSPRHEGVAIYENGVALPNTTPDHTGSNVIEFSAIADRLYGYNNETTEFGFRRMNVSSSGVSVLDVTANLISGFGVDIEFADGVVYATSGVAIDPEARIRVGTYGASGPIEPDPANRRVFFLTGSSSSTTLRAFDMDTFVPIGEMAIPNVSGSPANLIRWGSDGLAFRTSGDQIVLVRSDLVGGGFRLDVAGTCPGSLTATASGATPGGNVAFLFALGAGNATVPPGNPCAGTTLGLNGTARLVGLREADGSGAAILTGNAPPSTCDGFLQALDVGSCATTDVVPVP